MAASALKIYVLKLFQKKGKLYFMKSSYLSCLLTILATLSSAAIAGQIDREAFTPNESHEVSFARLPFNFGRPGPVVADGITFTSGGNAFRTYPASAPINNGPDVQVCAEKGCIMTDSELDYISVSLPSPVSMVGAYLGIPNVATTAVAEFYSGAMLLGSVNISAAPFQGVFAGWDAGSPIITSVKFIDNEEQQFVLGLTGFTYQATSSIPELSTFSQTSLGIILALQFFHRRRLRPSIPA